MHALVAMLPEHPPCIVVVGKNASGDWLVQEGIGFPHRHFASFDAAMAFARAERQFDPDATIAVSCAPCIARPGH